MSSPMGRGAASAPLKRSHDWIDQRSFALAEAVAAKLRRDPNLVDTARRTLARWKCRRSYWPPALEEWERILEGSLDDVLSRLLDPGEEGKRMRQSHPFTGILSPAERKAVLDRYEAIGA